MAKDQPVIFLVDEDERYILSLKDLLNEKLDFKTHIYTYTSGEQCLSNLNLQPDIIVMDYYFSPQEAGSQTNKPLNGIELIGLIKAKNPGIHLILLSNETDVEVANLAINEGAYDYIIKYEYAPIQLQYLISNIILNRIFNQKVNYWKWGAIVIGVLFIMVLIYLVSGAKH